MPREKKDAKMLNMKMATPVHEQLVKFCAENGVSKTSAVESILAEYFERHGEMPEKKHVAIQ